MKCFRISLPWEYPHEHEQELGTWSHVMTSAGTPVVRSARPGWYGSGRPTRASMSPSVLASWTAPSASASHSRGLPPDEDGGAACRLTRTLAPGILSLTRISTSSRISAVVPVSLASGYCGPVRSASRAARWAARPGQLPPGGPVWTVRSFRVYLLAAVDEPAGVVMHARAGGLTASARCPGGPAFWPRPLSAWAIGVTHLAPGGRGPCGAPPLRRAGRPMTGLAR